MGKNRSTRRPQRSKMHRSLIRAATVIGDGVESRAYRIAMNSQNEGIR